MRVLNVYRSSIYNLKLYWTSVVVKRVVVIDPMSPQSKTEPQGVRPDQTSIGSRSFYPPGTSGSLLDRRYYLVRVSREEGFSHPRDPL